MESRASSAVKESSSCFLLVTIQEAGCRQLWEEQSQLFGEGLPALSQAIPRLAGPNVGVRAVFQSG